MPAVERPCRGAISGVLRHQYPQSAYPARLRAGGGRVPRLVRESGVTSLPQIQPLHVASWIELQGREVAAPSVKKQLAAMWQPDSNHTKPVPPFDVLHALSGLSLTASFHSKCR